MSRERVMLFWPRTEFGYMNNVLPLGLGYLTANLPDRVDVRIWDGELDRLPIDRAVEAAEAFGPGVAGLSVWACNLAAARELATALRRRLPALRLVAGGPEPSGRGVGILEALPVDYALAGEAEGTFGLLLEALWQTPPPADRLALIPGLIWRDGEGRARANPTAYNEALNVSFCDYAAIRLDEYIAKGYRYGWHRRATRTAPVVTTRGCPYPCAYCSARAVNGTRVRKRPIDRIVGELRHLRQRHGIDGFNIVDDNFTFDVEFAKSVCRAILDLGWSGVSFNCPNGIRAERLDEELLGLMKRAGWEMLFLAPESGSPATLARMRKRLDLGAMTRSIELIRRSGLDVFGFFMIGYPGETEADVRMTIDWACAQPLDAAVFTCFHPLAGTPVYEELRAAGELAGLLYETDYHVVSYAPRGMTPSRLRRLRLEALARFYLLSPRRISALLRYKSLSGILAYARRVMGQGG